jgi:hypothetical protein
MTELDQQMFLLNVEVDGSDISEALNLICPGPVNKNVRQILYIQHNCLVIVTCVNNIK